QKKITGYTLDPPAGRDPEAVRYVSIQEHFPPVYGVGSKQLPSSALRKAQALQLKGYLLFFEQLLADYLAQLANIKSLFAMNEPEEPYRTSYFSQSLKSLEPGSEKFHLFTGDYETDLPKIAEPPGEGDQPGMFCERRNRFLDHLMARFCESFSDYALFRYATEPNARTAAESLIRDKVSFLGEYPVLSRERARAFNYLAQKQDGTPDLWDTDNVSGLKKNIVRRLGLKSYMRKNMYDFLTIEETSSSFTFKLNYGEYSLESTVDFPDKNSARKVALQVDALAARQENYVPVNVLDLPFSFELIDGEKKVIPLTAPAYDAEADRDVCMQHIQQMSGRLNFHILEHLLLRPDAIAGTDIPPVPLVLPVAEGELPVQDPYSFRISFILPIQHPRFGDPGFRQYAEKVIRSETPAHIVPHIYWVNVEQMYDFEIFYKAWLTALDSDAPDSVM
ncbi:MAG: hypothetical protein KDD04_08720, partial [Sinomicrobium sp.]|nr:hypothetical protein [Sinomicrobium sp.]